MLSIFVYLFEKFSAYCTLPMLLPENRSLLWQHSTMSGDGDEQDSEGSVPTFIATCDQVCNCFKCTPFVCFTDLF